MFRWPKSFKFRKLWKMLPTFSWLRDLRNAEALFFRINFLAGRPRKPDESKCTNIHQSSKFVRHWMLHLKCTKAFSLFCTRQNFKFNFRFSNTFITIKILHSFTFFAVLKSTRTRMLLNGCKTGFLKLTRKLITKHNSWTFQWNSIFYIPTIIRRFRAVWTRPITRFFVDFSDFLPIFQIFQIS